MKKTIEKVGGWFLIAVSVIFGVYSFLNMQHITLLTLSIICTCIAGTSGIVLLLRTRKLVAVQPATESVTLVHHMSMIERQNELLEEWNNTSDKRDKLKILGLSTNAEKK